MRNQCRFVISSLIFCLLILGLHTVPAAAASEDAWLLGVWYAKGKGIRVVLKVNEDVDVSQPASVFVNGSAFRLTCRTQEESSHFRILVCLAKAPKSAIWATATIWFGEASFQAIVASCYTVYDFGPADIPWGRVGQHCQKVAPEIGDIIRFHNPNWPLTPYWNYRYDVDSSKGCGGHSPNFGNGYYFYC